MLGETCNQLIQDLRRCQGSTLPNYDEDSVRRVTDEMKALYEANQGDVVDAGAANATENLLIQAVLIRHSALERNKRCLLAYHFSRLNQIKEMRWHFGPILPKEIKQHLSEPEIAWLQSYTRNLARYMASCDLDLTAAQCPPKEVHVEVRCLQDYGELETENGQIVHLKKDTHHHLLLSDCEALIRQGVLEHITGN